MERHLLITVSEQLSAFYGVKFVGHFFSNKTEMKLTLFYIAPRPAAVWEGERTLDSLSLTEQKYEEIEAKGEESLAEAKKELVKLGFHSSKIKTKLQFRSISKVLDIIQEGTKGLYDALVLGRRGLSWLEEAFDESVSKGILDEKVNFPIWVCRKPDLQRKDVLVCVDGSDAAYRAVDHVGFILAKEISHRITLFTVKKKGETSNEDVESILAKSREHLMNNEIPEEMIKTKVVEGGNIAKAITKEVNEGQYAAVAVGRTGTGQGFFEKIFMGSVSDTLFKELEKTALWISH